MEEIIEKLINTHSYAHVRSNFREGQSHSLNHIPVCK